MELIFEEPPVVDKTRNGAPSKYADWLNAVRQHPGVWVKWPDPFATKGSAYSRANDIRAGKLSGCDLGEFDARGRTVDGQFFLYVRYVGGAS